MSLLSDNEFEKKAQELFEQALELDADLRQEFLSGQCEDDIRLLEYCRKLIDNDPSFEDYFQFLYGNKEGDATSRNVAFGTGSGVGPYQIKRKLGRGGMADVYLAHRIDGVHDSDVAIKIVQDCYEKGNLINRFNSERRILANLKHPNIAQLLDGGSTDEGLPYFVMEYVEGTRIDEYCDREGLSIRQRLDVFIKLCSAVSFAHQNLVIHRDIKPSNILVNKSGEPKLLDFGLAKISDVNSKQDFTVTGIAMTPSYASPEQSRGEVLTTASDIYSLGILLYELLVGSRPYQITQDIHLEFEKMSSQSGVTLPSKAVLERCGQSTIDKYNIERGHGRKLSEEFLLAKKNSRELKGDIDTILMKMLRREPQRRYHSVQALIEDIERHLTCRPILAGKDSFWYRSNLFVKRHYAKLTIVFVAVVLSSIAVGYQQFRVLQERDIAEIQRAIAEKERRVAEKERDASNIQRDLAVLERNKFKQVQDFMIELFDISNPGTSRGNNITAREILDRGVTNMRYSLEDQPEAKSELLNTMGVVYLELGIYEQAEQLLIESLTLRQSVFGEENVFVAESLNHLGSLHLQKGNLLKANDYYRSAHEIVRKHGTDRADLVLAESWLGLGLIANQKAEYQESLNALDESLSIRKAHLGGLHSQVADSYDAMGSVKESMGEHDKAMAYYLDALSIRREVFGNDHPDVAKSYSLLANVHDKKSDFKQSAIYSQKVLDIRSKLYSENHPDIAEAHFLLARSYSDSANYEEAVLEYKKSLDVGIKALGESNLDIANYYNGLAIAYMNMGDVPRSIEICEKVLSIRIAILGEDHPDVSKSYNNIATNYMEIEKYDESIFYYNKSLEIKKRTLGEVHPSVALAYGNIANVYGGAEKFGQAIKYNLIALDIYERLPQPHKMYYAMFNTNLGAAYVGVDELDKGIEYLKIALASVVDVFGDSHPAVAHPLQGLGDAYEKKGNVGLALDYFNQALEIREKVLGKDNSKTISLQQRIMSLKQR